MSCHYLNILLDLQNLQSIIAHCKAKFCSSVTPCILTLTRYQPLNCSKGGKMYLKLHAFKYKDNCISVQKGLISSALTATTCV